MPDNALENKGISKEDMKTPEQREAELAVSREIALTKYPFTEEDRLRYENVAATISQELVQAADQADFAIPVEAIERLNRVVQSIGAREKMLQIAINDDIIDIVKSHQGNAAELYHALAESLRPFAERGKTEPPTEEAIGELKSALEELSGMANSSETIEAISQYNHLLKGLVEAHMSPGEGRERQELRIENMAEVLEGIVSTIIEQDASDGEIVEAVSLTAQDVLEIFRTSKMKVPKNFNSANVDFKRDIWFAMHTVARNHPSLATVYETENGPELSIATMKKE